MIYPPLPTPEIIEGRRLYTAGQMREYAKMCAESEMAKVDASRMRNNASGQAKVPPAKEGFGQYSAAVDNLIKSMGMKK